MVELGEFSVWIWSYRLDSFERFYCEYWGGVGLWNLRIGFG